MRGTFPRPIEDPGSAARTSPDHTIFIESVEPRAIPVREISAVLIGTVSSASAFLTEDKTGIYSEFSLQVQQLIWSRANSPAAPAGNRITAIRQGGAVRFPSGRVERFLYAGQGVPRVGGTYVFFLRWDADLDAYGLYTGYELTGGKVDPLDGEPQFERFRGVAVVDFVELVKDTIRREQNE